ncbi:MAG: transposase [Tunicatimonas sp.]|uniref:RNA-guided endonuclease InsQ/TnpB family protein n=1 Tax=Tunicatimonas sp. TaxID=1940096 RepID=UPI003C70A1BA
MNVRYILYISDVQTITYKRKLKLNKQQQQRVDSWIGACRYVYNLALETRIEAWKKQKSVGKYELMKQLPALKSVDWIADVPSQSLQNVIERLDVAYQNFFAGGGFPRWAAKQRYNSILFKSVQVQGNMVRLPKLGMIKTFKDRFVHGTPKIATIIREHDGYYICITSTVDAAHIAQYPIRLASESQAVGLDMGIAHFCVNTAGEYTPNPRHFAKYERQLRIANRSLARRKRGSANWYKKKAKLSRLHAKIGRVRRDFLHQQSWKVIRDNGLIAVEDLKVRNMVRSRLAKHISDAGWSTFRNQLAYKSDWYGRTLIAVDPKYTSQTCSECGHKEKENRQSQAKFVCRSCGVEQNADVNAAKNILARALANVSQRDALACA